jgi:hypothetical protein
LLATVAAAIAGCGNAQELHDANQVPRFIESAAEGKAGDWKLAGGASSDAVRAWLNRSTIEELGKTLREKGPEWACKAAEDVENAHKVLGATGVDVTPGDRNQIVSTAEEGGATPDDANVLIKRALKLWPFELTKTVADLCGAAKQL